jgi:hypothetical protein
MPDFEEKQYFQQICIGNERNEDITRIDECIK